MPRRGNASSTASSAPRTILRPSSSSPSSSAPRIIASRVCKEVDKAKNETQNEAPNVKLDRKSDSFTHDLIIFGKPHLQVPIF